MKPDGVSAIQLDPGLLRISYHYIGTSEEACDLFGVHEIMHGENPMPTHCIKCEAKDASATNKKSI